MTKNEQTPRVPQTSQKDKTTMKTLLPQEALELTAEVTKLYIHYKNKYGLDGNTSCQFMARICCTTLEEMVENNSEELRKHIEHCLTTISCRKEYKSQYGENVSYVTLYDGEIPFILNEMKIAYKRIPDLTKELDRQHRNKMALWRFFDDVLRLLQGCNHQEVFSKPPFMEDKTSLS